MRNDDKRAVTTAACSVASFWLSLLLVLFCLAMCSCARRSAAPAVVEARTELSASRDSIRINNIATADTVRQTRFVFVSGDTLRIYDRDERISRVEIHDTCYVTLTDSVTRYVPRPYPVERKLSRWEQVKQDYGGYAIVLIALAVALFVFSLFNRKK